jgi:hypothetical protein
VRLRTREITIVSYKRGSQAVEDAIGPLDRICQICKVYVKEVTTDTVGSKIMVHADRGISAVRWKSKYAHNLQEDTLDDEQLYSISVTEDVLISRQTYEHHASSATQRC